ncbi:component of TRAPP complex, partial [Haematococcus lacustris]
AGVLTFVVVGQQDHPIYEADLTGPKEQQAQYLHQFVLHAALDAVDEAMWMTKEPYLKTVDRFNNLLVTAFVTPGNARFLLLHDGRNEESMRNFFLEAYELYIKVILNPLQQPTMRISNREFDRKIRLLAKRFFN